jgi:ubiquinone/menaquinone biosynthesis C-methylase UbiE
MYNVEEYWSNVADRIDDRSGRNIIAGDDEPYYRLKRKKFLDLFRSEDYSGKSILEIGPGPGGNLSEVFKKNPGKLVGADISQSMIELAGKHINPSIELVKIDGSVLPFKSDSFDYIYTVTVLQHNTDKEKLEALMAEMARVSANEIVIYERVESEIRGDKLNFGRPIEYYASFFKKHGFELKTTRFLDIQLSYMLAGFSRRYLNSNAREEGEPLNKFSLFVQTIGIPITSFLDKFISQKRDLAQLRFVKIK